MNNGRVEAPKRIDSTMNEAKPSKALLSNHRDVLSPSDLGVNPHAQIAYMGDPSQRRALKAEAQRRVLLELRDDHGVIFHWVEGYLPINGLLAHQVEGVLP